MVKLNVNTQNVLVYGTDGEKELGRDLGDLFHTLSTYYVTKLSELGIQGKDSDTILTNMLKNVGSRWCLVS